MNGYIGYIRVSTVKQGTKGVSLQEQRDAILRYAERNRFTISVWLEEMVTAAKKGRPVFAKAMKLLRAGKARGIILHKLDRGARNLWDWAEIGGLSDRGIEVHFVNESLDLQSRGGRLSADIQAVVAADYIRNLREETRKGFYGRLKQGFYPIGAPIGYLDQGGGKPKTIDPVMGPLVRKAFDLYATGGFNLERLGNELYRLGLRNRNGGRVTRTGLSNLLNNPFYFGLMKIYKTNEVFPGVHEPIIGKALFDRVRAVLTGKTNARSHRHSFLFRRLLSCAECGYSLIAERQKGHVYYRCHSMQCRGTSVREEAAESKVSEILKMAQFSEEEKAYLRPKVLEMRKTWKNQVHDEIKSQSLKLAQTKDRLNRLTDAYLDQALDKAMFEERKQALLMEEKSTEDNLTRLSHNIDQTSLRLEKFLEQAGTAWLTYLRGIPDEKRRILKIATSNRSVAVKNIELEPSLAFQLIVNRFKNADCDPQRDIPRTWDKILTDLSKLNVEDQLPDLSTVSGFPPPPDSRTGPSDPFQRGNTRLPNHRL